MSLQGKLLSLLALFFSCNPLFQLSHQGAFSLTHSLLLFSIRLSLIVCLSLFLSLAPCDGALGEEVSPVYTGTDGHGGNVRLILSESRTWL